MKNSFLTICFFILLSCTPGKVFEKHVKMENLAWNRFNTVIFEVPVENTSAGYDIYAAIRHHTDIPYSELEVNVYMTGPGGETRSRDIIIKIRDKDGKNLGEGLGELWDIQSPVWKGIHFSEAGTCTIEVSSGMSHLNVVGIMEVGLVVKKSR